MSQVVGYGLDFGTTNSAIAAVFENGDVELIKAEPAGVVPSLLYLSRDSNRLAGTMAVEAFLASGAARTRCRQCDLVSWVGGEPMTDCRQVKRDGFCLDARLLSQVKSFLSDRALDGTHSWGVDFEVEDLVAIVIGQLKRAADEAVGADVKQVAIGHPVRFVGAEGQGFREAQQLACQRLEEAARRAGFEHVTLVPESQAAVAVDDVPAGLGVCTDFGGGTFDCAVVDVMGNDINVLALEGVAVGGEDFDALIFDNFVREAIGLDDVFSTPGGTRQLPARLRSRLRSLSGLRSLLADGELTLGLAELYGRGNDRLLDLVGELLYGGQALPFYKAIESAKIELSTVERTTLSFRRGWIDLGVEISRDELDKVLAPSMNRVRDRLGVAVANAGLDPKLIDWITTTGGSSQIPCYGAMLSSLFPNAEIQTQDPFTSVVRGLADYAGHEWGTDE